MDQAAQIPLIRSFERYLRAENRSERTIATYLIGLRQADAFLRAHGTTLQAATRTYLEAFLADLLTRRTASTAATYYKPLKLLYAWLVEEEEIPADPMRRMKRPIVPDKPVPIVPADGLKRLLRACAGTPSRRAATPPCSCCCWTPEPAATRWPGSSSLTSTWSSMSC